MNYASIKNNDIIINMRKIKKPKIKTWWLVVTLIPLVFVDATLLRFDHVRMTELRAEVLAADEADDEALVAEKLEELKNYVFNNIVINVVDDNGEQKVTFGTGPFYLEHMYLRAANAALEEAEQRLTSDENPNGNVYQMASEVCRPQAIANGWNWNDSGYINCMTTEINKYPAADEIQSDISAAIPSTELYRKNYASPVWAPSFTGFMILVTLVIIVVIIIKMIWWIVLRLSLLLS